MNQIKIPLLFVAFCRVALGMALFYFVGVLPDTFTRLTLGGFLMVCYLGTWLPSDLALAGVIVLEKVRLVETLFNVARHWQPGGGGYPVPTPTTWAGAYLPSETRRNETAKQGETVGNEAVKLLKIGTVAKQPFKLYSGGLIEFDGQLYDRGQVESNLRAARSQLNDPKRPNARKNFEKYSALADVLAGNVPNGGTISSGNFTISG
jgi:hypothetical protein